MKGIKIVMPELNRIRKGALFPSNVGKNSLPKKSNSSQLNRSVISYLIVHNLVNVLSVHCEGLSTSNFLDLWHNLVQIYHGPVAWSAVINK